MCDLTFLGGYFKKEIDKIESILQRKGKWVDMRKVCSFTVSSSHQGSPGQSLLRDPPTRPTPQIKPLLDTANKSRWELKYTFFRVIMFLGKSERGKQLQIILPTQCNALIRLCLPPSQKRVKLFYIVFPLHMWVVSPSVRGNTHTQQHIC